MHTTKGVRIVTLVAHLIWCAVHTSVFTVYSDENSAHVWPVERQKRITASTAGRIARRGPKMKVAKLML